MLMLNSKILWKIKKLQNSEMLSFDLFYFFPPFHKKAIAKNCNSARSNKMLSYHHFRIYFISDSFGIMRTTGPKPEFYTVVALYYGILGYRYIS